MILYTKTNVPQRNTQIISLFLLLTIIIFAGCSSNVNEQKVKEKLTGKWEGLLNFPNVKYKLILDFIKDKDNNISVKLSSPRQKVYDMPADSVVLSGSEISFKLPKVRVYYQGKLDLDSSIIKGTWKQEKFQIPLSFYPEGEMERINRPQYPKKPYPYNSEEVIIDNIKANVQLAGTITYPKGSGPFPAVLLINGSGPQDRDETIYDHKPFLVMSDFLTRKGFAVLRVDDRGFGASTGSYKNSTTKDFAEDALQSVQYLKNRKDIDSTRIGLIGFNEGGIIASMVESRAKDIDFIVLLATPGLPGKEVLLTQTKLIQKAQGVPEKEIEQDYKINKKVFSIVETTKDSSAAIEKVKNALKEFISNLNDEEKSQRKYSEANIVRKAKFMMSPWFRYYLSFDPVDALKRIKCPVLVLYGKNDIQIEPKENLNAVVKAIKKGGNHNVESEIIPGLNHLFQTSDTGLPEEYSKIKETFSPKALEVIDAWIEKVIENQHKSNVALK